MLHNRCLYHWWRPILYKYRWLRVWIFSVAGIKQWSLALHACSLKYNFFCWFQNFRHKIIGYGERTYTYQPDGSFFYGVYRGTKPYPGYAMMVGATTIFHRAYLEMYFDPNVLPQGVFEYINDVMNCDDIALSIMVTKFLEDVSWKQTAALPVKLVGEIHNWENKACK